MDDELAADSRILIGRLNYYNTCLVNLHFKALAISLIAAINTKPTYIDPIKSCFVIISLRCLQVALRLQSPFQLSSSMFESNSNHFDYHY